MLGSEKRGGAILVGLGEKGRAILLIVLNQSDVVAIEVVDGDGVPDSGNWALFVWTCPAELHNFCDRRVDVFNLEPDAGRASRLDLIGFHEATDVLVTNAKDHHAFDEASEFPVGEESGVEILRLFEVGDEVFDVANGVHAEVMIHTWERIELS